MSKPILDIARISGEIERSKHNLLQTEIDMLCYGNGQWTSEEIKKAIEPRQPSPERVD